MDDEEDVRLLLTFVIDKANDGLRVAAQAANGQEAVVLRREADIDAVVLDYRMPGLNGIETARAMLAEEPDLPIVLYSAFTDAQVTAEAQQLGVRDCVAKGDVPSLISSLRSMTGLDGGGPHPS
ncbi:MAG: response regulator transcription factor [Microthrixaceae bacterium]